MIKRYNIYNQSEPQKIYIDNTDTYVYIRENIQKITDNDKIFFKYDELVYTKDEYKLIELEQARNTQEEMLINLTYDMIMLQNNL